MKRIVIYMLFVLWLVNLDAQEIYQQTAIELDGKLEESKSYLCQATASIELHPGFTYNPSLNNEMSLSIDRYSVFPPVTGVYGGNEIDDNCVVGSIPGTIDFGVTGAANYSIDVHLPQALGGMIPKLSIVYNSQGTDGLLGWSWDLLGLSSIERVGQTEYHDGKVTGVGYANDRYIFDGQRLMSVGNGEYKTEVDNFDKIVSYNESVKGPDYFIVWKSDGTVWEYGVTEDSKVEPQRNNTVVLKWLLNKITDRNGNSIVYNYYENNATGESYIKSIEYTSNEKAKVLPAYSVEFKYDEKVDARLSYVQGSQVLNAKILSKIEVHNNYSGKKIIEYSLGYYEPGYYDNNYYLHYRLNSIELVIDGVKVNPTKIIWNSKDKMSAYKSVGFKQYELDKNIFNKASFVGDFNGDGFSDVLLVPYKIKNTYAENIQGEVYLNNGDGSFAETPLTKVTFGKNLEWIYVCDMDGDGVDDIIPYEIYYDDMGNFDVVRFGVFIMTSGKFINIWNHINVNAISLFPGYFLDKDKCSLLLIDAYDGDKNKNLAKCVYFKDGKIYSDDIEDSNVINGKENNYIVMDMSGDGVSELLALEKDGYKTYRLKNASNLKLEYYCSGYGLTSKIHTFPNDYNGDGKMDVLYYDPASLWNIAFSKGNSFTSPMPCLKNNLLQNVRLNDKDKYRYSLKEMQKPMVTIRTADFDGDGTADVGVFNNHAGNYYLQIGYSLYEDSRSTCMFRYNRRYYMPINYSHQTIQLGRFLPQENVSILSGLPQNPLSSNKAYVVSLCPNSAYYSVEKIIDGLGNVMEFSYDYLMCNAKGENDFYTCESNVNNYNVAKRSVPIMALKEQKTYSVNGKSIVKKYNYHNALVHKKGHGFMGFEKVTIRTYVDNNLVDKHMLEYSLEPLDCNCIPLMTSEKMYKGESQILKERYLEYKKYSCNRNPKVILPMLSLDMEISFDVDKKDVLLKNVVTTNIYESDVPVEGKYDNIVKLKMTRKGYDGIWSSVPENCQYYEETKVEYDDDIAQWIINRPKKITKYVSGKDNDVIGDVRLMEYAPENPFRVVKETMVPNVHADTSDSLTIVQQYKYDIVGNVVEQMISSPSLKKDKILRSEYGANYRYRYKTKTIDEIGREVVCKYDDNFGMLESTIDYNNKISRIECKPFGIESVVTLPDGMKTINVLRWSEDNQYAPENSTYYLWEKCVGKAETIVFYHKTGVELRNVTFDLNGKAVFVDKEYDDWGNLIRESYPYYENENKMFVSHVYDVYNRIVETEQPNGNKIDYMYDGNNVQTEYTTYDAKKKHKKESYNFMGWLTSVVDNGGERIKYEYYSNGKIKSAQIGENGNSRILLAYDGRGNKTLVHDPNYGQMSYKYDALGNIIRISNAQYVVDMEYDVLGRMMQRTENNLQHKTMRVVRWEYSCDKGYDGLLSRVSSSGGHHIEYGYDDKFRLAHTMESINGKSFKTTYSYDAANRVETITYPSGFCVLKRYSNAGYEKMVCDAKTDLVLWRTEDVDSKGHITEFQLGNGIKTKCSYNAYHGAVENIETKMSDVVYQNMSYNYDGVGNLIYRCDAYNNYEEFEYDSYDRLDEIILNGEVNGRVSYRENNIRDKEVNGVKVLYNTVYSKNKLNAIVSAKSDDERIYERFNQKIEYSTFDNVIAVNCENKTLSIGYGVDNERIFMQYNIGDKMMRKRYAGDCEYIEEDGKTKILTYIEGPMGVFAVHVDDGEEQIHYIHKDNLGSWNVITNESGEVLQEMSFDAWGNLRNPQNWREGVEDVSILHDRGFTGHEHLWEFGLINMNGRMYDPLLSMMLSPDNNIQVPQSSQGFNRYSYCLNNPLRYHDPTGEFVESIAFGVVGGAANLVFNARNIDSFGEAALLFGVGFVKGFLTEYTMGQSWFLQVGVGAVTEGLVAGANCMVNIGDGNFEFSGDDWNSVKSASQYGLGSGLVKSFMYTYINEPTETQYGESFFESSSHRELAHGLTSIAAHGMGCWFSGQPFLTSMKFKDVGFDLKMLGIIAKRLLSSYIYRTGIGEKALDERAKELKNSILNDLLTEIPDTPDFEYICELKGVFVDDFRLYVVGNIFQMIPGEWLDCYPKPYLEEVITFPFSYSLFKTLFFNKE